MSGREQVANQCTPAAHIGTAALPGIPERFAQLLLHQLYAEVLAHVHRVGRCIWKRH